jgi:hypothetical protein
MKSGVATFFTGQGIDLPPPAGYGVRREAGIWM